MSHIKIKLVAGVIENQAELNRFLAGFGSGTVYLSAEKVSDLHDVEDYRRVYFLFRDVLWQAGSRGYSKKEFHHMLKGECLVKILEDEENFRHTSVYDQPPPLSTKTLTLIGWKRYLDLVKEFAKDEFNIFL